MIVTMAEEAWKTISGTMMTTERIAAYGGIGFPREVLESAASTIMSNGLPMHIDHRLGRPVRTRNMVASIESRSDGVDLLRFTVEIHPDDAHWASELGAISTTINMPTDRPSSYVAPDAPEIEISADHAWFDDEAILAAESAILAAGVRPDLVAAERAFQFSVVPDPQIFVSVAMDLLTGLGSSAIWEAVLTLFRSRRTPPDGDAEKSTTINITFVDGGPSVTAVIETNSEAVAFRALDSLDGMVQAMGRESGGVDSQATQVEQGPHQPSVVTWDDTSRTWTPPT